MHTAISVLYIVKSTDPAYTDVGFDWLVTLYSSISIVLISYLLEYIYLSSLDSSTGRLACSPEGNISFIFSHFITIETDK